MAATLLVGDVIGLLCPQCSSELTVPAEEQVDGLFFVTTCRTCGLTFDWRLPEEKEYLRGAKLHWQDYQDEYYWLCDTCFEDFKDQFDWQVEPSA